MNSVASISISSAFSFAPVAGSVLCTLIIIRSAW
jgi:hypothetical protein